MRQSVKNKSFEELSQLTGNVVNFISNCDFFPNFNVTGRVLRIDLSNNEIMFEVSIHPNDRVIKIGSNMKNLTYEIL